MLILRNIAYQHSNKDLLFHDISLTVTHHQKIALVGNNGTGKSTLLKIIAGELQPSGGELQANSQPYYVPQNFGQYNHLTIAEALRAAVKLTALKEILDGNPTAKNLDLLDDDWTIEERCLTALQEWQLGGLDLSQKMETLSGGQKTKVFLAGITAHQPELVLLDEPSNHLDDAGRQQLYHFIQHMPGTLIVVSHDKILLNLVDTIGELSSRGLSVYGGNYDFYAEQKHIAGKALLQDIHSKEKALRKARDKERESAERQQRLDARGKGKQEKAGVAKIMMNTLRNNAENSTAKLKTVHTEKIGGISRELQELRSELPGADKMKFDFADSALHKGKVLFTATGINFSHNTQPLWKHDLSLQITSGERIALQGSNGSGKTTLIKIILGQAEPKPGLVHRSGLPAVYIDQDYSLIDNSLSIYEQAQQFNSGALQEHEIKIRLNRFLFTKEHWNKPCSALSGGERMRLMLCCLGMSNQPPGMIILDEPTNNLDIQNMEILTAAVNDYQGTLIVVSHDQHFLAQLNLQRTISL